MRWVRSRLVSPQPAMHLESFLSSRQGFQPRREHPQSERHRAYDTGAHPLCTTEVCARREPSQLLSCSASVWSVRLFRSRLLSPLLATHLYSSLSSRQGFQQRRERPHSHRHRAYATVARPLCPTVVCALRDPSQLVSCSASVLSLIHL